MSTTELTDGITPVHLNGLLTGAPPHWLFPLFPFICAPGQAMPQPVVCILACLGLAALSLENLWMLAELPSER